MRKAFKFVLKILAKGYIARYRPMIIAITGNVGKTSTKEAIMAVLRGYWRVRVSVGNLNNEWGVPLSVLGDWGGEYYERGGALGFWLKVLGRGLMGWLVQSSYPEVLVLEYGAERPGDIQKLVSNFKPHLAVVTAVGEIPVHVEYFSSPEDLTEEKSKLVEKLSGEDFAILNVDDEQVASMRGKTKARSLTFGFGEGAMVRISGFDLKTGSAGEPLGVVFELYHQGNSVPCQIEGSLGRSQAWSAAAAAATGIALGLNLAQVSAGLRQYRGPVGRMKILKGVRGSWIIDDTYNASPSSAHLALETVRGIVALRQAQGKTTRVLAVLGDMLELGEYTEKAHREAGNFAGTIADWLITVGPRAKFMADAAGNQLSQDRILSFNDSREAAEKIPTLIQDGDLILVKGSQGMRMERIVEVIMAEPEKKHQFLVRQSQKWLNKV